MKHRNLMAVLQQLEDFDISRLDNATYRLNTLHIIHTCTKLPREFVAKSS